MDRSSFIAACAAVPDVCLTHFLYVSKTESLLRLIGFCFFDPDAGSMLGTLPTEKSCAAGIGDQLQLYSAEFHSEDKVKKERSERQSDLPFLTLPYGCDTV